MASIILHEVDFNVPGTVSRLPWYDGDPAHFDATSLRYVLYPSRVTFSVGEVVVMGPRIMVPLFDLLSCIALMLPDIRRKKPASMDFTESADRILFNPATGDTVKIIYAEARSRPGAVYFHETRKVLVDREELVDTLTSFLASGLRTMTDNVAGLGENQHVKALLAQC
jgi:hypothetical protein